MREHRSGPLQGSLFGLAPDGVFRASSLALRAVRSYRTFSPFPVPLPEQVVCFLWHFPSERLAASPPACIPALRARVTRHRTLRWSDFPPSSRKTDEGDSPPFQNQLIICVHGKRSKLRNIQIPNTRLQRISKHQSPKGLQFSTTAWHCSKLEICFFSEAWRSGFGAFSRPPPGSCRACNKVCDRSSGRSRFPAPPGTIPEPVPAISCGNRRKRHVVPPPLRSPRGF